MVYNKLISDCNCPRLPGPSRVPAAGSSTKVQGASNLNRRSQSFNSIDKNKPPQYANGNEKGKCLTDVMLLNIQNLRCTVHHGRKYERVKDYGLNLKFCK